MGTSPPPQQVQPGAERAAVHAACKHAVHSHVCAIHPTSRGRTLPPVHGRHDDTGEPSARDSATPRHHPHKCLTRRASLPPPPPPLPRRPRRPPPLSDTLLVDIRELYRDKATGEMRPGAKGISLNVEQFAKLEAAMGGIRAALEGAGAKWPEPGGEAGASSSSSAAAADAAEQPSKKQKTKEEEGGDDDDEGGDGEDVE
jgi:hypothetical protein